MRTLFLYRFGATLLVLFALAHAAGHLASAGAAAPSDPTEAEIRRLHAEHRFELLGVSRTFDQIHAGLSLSLAGFALLAGLLLLRISGQLRAVPALLAETAWIAGAACGILAGLNAWLTVPPPAVLLALAAAAFAASGWQLRHLVTQAGQARGPRG